MRVPTTRSPYKIVHVRKRIPDPGATSFALESFGLVPLTPIGPAITVREPILATPSAAPLSRGPVVGIEGIPTIHGDIVGQPLFDPDRGFTKDIWQAPNPLPFDIFNISPAGAAI